MHRLLCGLALAVSVCGAVVGAQQFVFRGEGDVVRVFATVTDRDGRLVTSLTQQDFEIRDNGRPQPIVTFDNQAQPIQLIVMFDVSGSMMGNLPLVQEAARQLIPRLNPEDRVRIGSFGNEIDISPVFTNDPNALLAALPKSIEGNAPTPLWRGIDQAMRAFDDENEARRVVLVLSDGRDSGSFSFGAKPVSQAQVIDEARERDVMIYAVGMRSRVGAPMGGIGVGRGAMQSMLAADMPDPGLARVAEESGGGYLELRASQDIGAVFAGVADELHRQYFIGYMAPERDGKVHDIEVRVATRGLKPRARKEYRAPGVQR